MSDSRYGLRTSEEWCEDQGIRVIDPDGWRRTGTPWDLPITVQEFWRLAGHSTIRDYVDPPRPRTGNPPRPGCEPLPSSREPFDAAPRREATP